MSTLHFESLVPVLLRSVPYILQSHVFKAFCALERLFALKPHYPDAVWAHCVKLLREDEPKVAGLIAPELLGIDEMVDHASGRDFGPDWILERGLMPLSYWAMHKKVASVGVDAVFEHYLEKALSHPRFLGHEISVLAGNWQFYRTVISQSNEPTYLPLFVQRLTEYFTSTFSHNNDTVFEHPVIHEVPPEVDLLKEALQNPGFFGHNVIALVWTLRIKPMLTEEQFKTALKNLTILVRWHEFGRAPKALEPVSLEWSETDFEAHQIKFFLEGPVNVHQITLADVLLWVWQAYPEHRGLVAANLCGFTQGTRA